MCPLGHSWSLKPIMPAHLQVLTTRPPDRKCWGGGALGTAVTWRLYQWGNRRARRGGAEGGKPGLHLLSRKTQPPLLVRSQGGLSVDVVRDKRHLRSLRRPQLEIGGRRTTGVTYRTWFRPRMSLPYPSCPPAFLCSYSDFLHTSSRRN